MKWWLRCVGAVYLLAAVLAGIVHAPVKALAPPGTLEHASAGEPVARLLVDTWVTLGMEYGALALAMFVAAQVAERARALVWTVLALELLRGMATDVYMMARGYAAAPHVIWLVVHSIIITTGVVLIARDTRFSRHVRARSQVAI